MTTPAAAATAPAPAAPSAPQPGAPTPGTTPAAPTQPAAPEGAPLAIGEATAEPSALIQPAPTLAYEPTGHAGLDMALGFVGGLGLGPQDPAIQAAEKGDFSLLKAKLGTMGDKARGWEGYLGLAEEGVKHLKAQATEKATKDTAAIHDAVGGKDNWAAISKWAGANADPAERIEVNEALAKGGKVAKAMALYLQGLYERAAGTVKEPAPTLRNGVTPTPTPTAHLTAAAYSMEVNKLFQKMGSRMEGSQEYKALQARRFAARAAGK